MDAEESLLWTVAETALQLRVSADTIRRAIKAGDLQPVRLGRCIRLEPAAVRAYVREHREPRVAVYRRRAAA